MQTMMHCEHSWSGPSGWMALAKQAFFWMTKEDWHPQWPSKTWFVLATLSAAVFLALPISGLSMEFSDGYVTSNQHPLVMGSTFDNFNLRMNDVPLSRAISLWEASVAPRAPHLGIIYTSPNQSHARDELSYLKTAPNSLPVEEGTSTLFLPPQAKTPITGNAWGLALRYNCTIAERASDFTILKHRNDSQRPRKGQYYVSYDVAEASANIFVQYPSTIRAKNVNMVLVIGSTAHYSPRLVSVDGAFTKDYRVGYFGNSTEAYPGLEVEELLELQLWQHLNMTVPSNISSALPPNTLNDTIDHPISDIQPPSNYTDGYVIGLRCTSSSAVGTADIDGRYSTYTNFQRTDTALGTGAFTVYTLAARLGWAIRPVILGGHA
ncbi:MAG: hypothetical protein Q9164_007778, partial [Protoblastenia rupestris]